MTSTIVLDTGPLGLLVQRPGVAPADECRAWLAGHAGRGVRFIVPEVADYELRRELLRVNLPAAVAKLDQLVAAPEVQYLPISTAAMRLGAQLWAQARQRGQPTADPHALDIDVLLAAQATTAALPGTSFIVATTNVGHLARFVPADLWSNIR
jgi:hypothetical protein